jgi:hypothetical protein
VRRPGRPLSQRAARGWSTTISTPFQREQEAKFTGAQPRRADRHGERRVGLEEAEHDQRVRQQEQQERAVREGHQHGAAGLLLPGASGARLRQEQQHHRGEAQGGQRVAEEEPPEALRRQQARHHRRAGEAEVRRPVERPEGRYPGRPLGDQVRHHRLERRAEQLAEEAQRQHREGQVTAVPRHGELEHRRRREQQRRPHRGAPPDPVRPAPRRSARPPAPPARRAPPSRPPPPRSALAAPSGRSPGRGTTKLPSRLRKAPAQSTQNTGGSSSARIARKKVRRRAAIMDSRGRPPRWRS